MDLDATHEEQEEEEEEEEGRIIRHHELQHFHVLAVDDSQTDRKFLERLLTVSSNYHVTCVDSGDEALKYLGLLQEIQENNNIIEYAAKRWSAPSSSSFPLSSVSHCHQSHSSNSSEQQQVSKVNLIMTDFSMPGMSGYDLLKRIKESASWKDIPVVVMSSENVPSRINMCLEGGAEDFLLKPVKASDLKRLHWNLQLTTMKNKDKSNEDNMMLMSGNKMQMGIVKGGVADHHHHHHHQLEMENDGSNNGNCCGGRSMNNGSSSGNINMAANKRKASLAASSDRSRPRVVQELPVS